MTDTKCTPILAAILSLTLLSACGNDEQKQTVDQNTNTSQVDTLDKPSIANPDWSYLDLTCEDNSCFEGDDCIFEFKNEQGEILKFTWFLSPDAEEGSIEREFQDSYKYDGASMGYPSLIGKKVRVYFDKNAQNPGNCESSEEEGLKCTTIKMLEVY